MSKEDIIDALSADLAECQAKLALVEDSALMWLRLASEKEEQLIKIRQAIGFDDEHPGRKAFRKVLGIADDHQLL
jgi:hypothetical protein